MVEKTTEVDLTTVTVAELLAASFPKNEEGLVMFTHPSGKAAVFLASGEYATKLMLISAEEATKVLEELVASEEIEQVDTEEATKQAVAEIERKKRPVH